jgi:hypothetical protein
MTGRAHTHNEVISATGFKFEGLIKGSYSVDFYKWHAEFTGHCPHGLFRDVTVVLLNIL